MLHPSSENRHNLVFFLYHQAPETKANMANTIVLSAEQQTLFRAHNIVRDQHDTIEQSWTGAVEPKTGDGKVAIALPDMFVRFLSEPPRVNPHYERVKAESEAWFAEYVKDKIPSENTFFF